MGSGSGPSLGTDHKEIHCLCKNNKSHEKLFCFSLSPCTSDPNMSVIKHSSPLGQIIPAAPQAPCHIKKTGSARSLIYLRLNKQWRRRAVGPMSLTHTHLHTCIHAHILYTHTLLLVLTPSPLMNNPVLEPSMFWYLKFCVDLCSNLDSTTLEVCDFEQANEFTVYLNQLVILKLQSI